MCGFGFFLTVAWTFQSSNPLQPDIDSLLRILRARDLAISTRTVAFEVRSRQADAPEWKLKYKGIEAFDGPNRRLDLSDYGAPGIEETQTWDGTTFVRTHSSPDGRPYMERGTTDNSLEEAWLPHNFGTTCLGGSVSDLIKSPHQIVGRSRVMGIDCLEVIVFKHSADSDSVDVPSLHFWLDDHNTLLVEKALILVQVTPGQRSSPEALTFNNKLVDVMSIYQLEDTFNFSGIFYPRRFSIKAVSPMLVSGFETDTLIDAEKSSRTIDPNHPFSVDEDTGVLIKDLRTGEFRPPGKTGEAVKGSAIKSIYAHLMDMTDQGDLAVSVDLDDQSLYDLNCADLSILIYQLLRYNRLTPGLVGGVTTGKDIHHRELSDIKEALQRLGCHNVTIERLDTSRLSALSKPCVAMVTNAKTRISHYYFLYPHAGRIVMVGPRGATGYLSKDSLDQYSAGMIDIIGSDLGIDHPDHWLAISLVAAVLTAILVVSLRIKAKRRSILVQMTIIPMLSLGTSCLKSPQRTGDLRCEGTSVFDAGETLPDSDVDHEFELVNDSAERVSILQVTRSCGCTQASLSKSSIEPGGHATLLVTMHITGPYGRNEKVFVEWADSKRKDVLICHISAAVRSHDRLITDRAGLSISVPEKGVTATEQEDPVPVHIQYITRDTSPPSLSLESPSWLRCTCRQETIEDAGFGYQKYEFELNITCSTGAVPGQIGAVVVSTQAANVPSLSIKVVLDTRSDFDIDPPSIFVQDFRGISAPNCVYLHRKARSQAIVSDVMAEAWIHATLEQEENGYRLCAMPTSPDAGTNIVSGHIVLHIQHGAQDQVSIAVDGVQSR